MNSFEKQMQSFGIGQIGWILIFCIVMPMIMKMFKVRFGKQGDRVNNYISIAVLLYAVGIAFLGPQCWYKGASFSETLFAVCCWPFYLAQRFAGKCKPKKM